MIFIGIVLLIVALIFAEAWVLMILVGVLHGWWSAIPSMSYWTALVIVGLLTLLVIPHRATGRDA